MTMKGKMMGAGWAAAFVAGVVLATALSGRSASRGAKTQAEVRQGQQVTVRKIISPTVTDEDIGLLRQDIRAMRM